jgi:hypothetical protein
MVCGEGRDADLGHDADVTRVVVLVKGWRENHDFL